MTHPRNWRSLRKSWSFTVIDGQWDAASESITSAWISLGHGFNGGLQLGHFGGDKASIQGCPYGRIAGLTA